MIRFRITILFILLVFPAFSQQLAFEVTGYRAYVVHRGGYSDKFSFYAPLDGKSGKLNGELVIYKLSYTNYRNTYQKNDKKDSMLVFRGTFKDGFLVDTARWYHNNGKLQRLGFFSGAPTKSSWDGCWYNPGKLSMCGAAEGELTEWYDNGVVHLKYHYTGGKQDGLQQIFYRSGQPMYEWTEVNGRYEGKHLEWYENGKLREINFYKDGSASGRWEYFREDGTIWRVSTNNGTGKRDTTWNYYPNGKLQSRIPYGDRGRDGDYYAYDSVTGKPKVYKHYTKGNQDSVEIRYYPSGAKKSSTRYRDGHRNGPYTAWHENGKIQETGQFYDDYRVGDWKYYDKTGKLTFTANTDDQFSERLPRSDEDDDGGPESSAEEVDMSYSLDFRVPVIRGTEKPHTLTKRMKFLEKYGTIDVVAEMTAEGKTTWKALTPMKPEHQEEFIAYLNATFPTGPPMAFGWDKDGVPCTVSFKITVVK